jgi:hypothetical protein
MPAVEIHCSKACFTGVIYITIDNTMVRSNAITEMMVSQTDQVFVV